MESDPRAAEFQRLYQLGLTHAQSGQEREADSAFLKAAKFAPDLWCGLASELTAENHPYAIKHLEVALALPCPNEIRSSLLNDIGRLHANAGHTSTALDFFKTAHALNPGHPGILSNLGLACRWLGDLKGAERWLKRALKQNPWESAASLELSFVTMLGGDYGRGFELYETRFRTPGGTLQKLETDKPEWDGTNGKKVFIYGEQGSGDIFLMLRYAKLIHALGVHQSWVVHKSMVSLVATIPEIDEVLPDGSPAPDFDCHLPAASLPRLFKTTLESIPDGQCIPRPDAHDFGPGFHVGIVWRGSKAQANDTIRSTNLDAWKPLLGVPGVTFHSLQVDGADEALLYPQVRFLEPAADWMETARRVCGLDLVIAVDTSIVHLCGALGVPVWCALHCRPYFVFPLVSENCPWYSSVRLFKQQREFQWKPVFEKIAYELTNRSPNALESNLAAGDTLGAHDRPDVRSLPNLSPGILR